MNGHKYYFMLRLNSCDYVSEIKDRNIEFVSINAKIELDSFK